MDGLVGGWMDEWMDRWIDVFSQPALCHWQVDKHSMCCLLSNDISDKAGGSTNHRVRHSTMVVITIFQLRMY